MTVGYGSTTARTIPELILAMIWMFLGVNFYSFLVGSTQSQISSEFKNTDTLKYKLRQLDEIKDAHGFDPELYFDITIFLQNNYKLMYGKVDEDKLQAELPPNL